MKVLFIISVYSHEARRPAKWKLKILGLLGIQHKPFYFWTVRFIVEGRNRTRVGDVIPFGDVNWMVEKTTDDGQITISTVTSTPATFHRDFFQGNSMPMIPSHRAYPEGRRAPAA